MLKTARKFYGYTQEELAQKIGKAQRYYTQIENGSSKSAPVIKKLSSILKLRESYLGSSGEYIEYPFLSDFYLLCIAEKDPHELYRYIVDDICSKSDFVDILFLLIRPSLIGAIRRPGGYPVMYVAIRDDRDTIFLFKRRMKTRGHPQVAAVSISEVVADAYALDATKWLGGRELDNTTFTKLDTFRDMLQSIRGTYVFETTTMVSEDLYHHIEDGAVTREDIVKLFPTPDYFEAMYQAHTKIKKR